MITPCTDRTALASFLERDAGLHLYELGDLAEPYWSKARYYVKRSGREIAGVVMIYGGSDPPTLLALARRSEEFAAALELLTGLMPELPARLYTHLSEGLERAFDGFGSREDRGQHLKYVLRGARPRDGIREATRLGPQDAAEVQAFLDASYPGNFFHARVLEDRMAFGIREDGAMRAFAGLHVLAPRFAALGNVATAPDVRGRGYARRCIEALVDALVAAGVETIGLNVERDNAAAIRLYERLGFARVATYAEAIYARG